MDAPVSDAAHLLQHAVLERRIHVRAQAHFRHPRTFSPGVSQDVRRFYSALYDVRRGLLMFTPLFILGIYYTRDFVCNFLACAPRGLSPGWLDYFMLLVGWWQTASALCGAHGAGMTSAAWRDRGANRLNLPG